MNQFEKIFHALQEANIQYLVVGGVAVSLYGYVRTTADLDLIMALEPENIRKMDTLMKSLGYEPRAPISLEELKNAETIHRLIEEKDMKAYTFTNRNSLFSIDILTEDSLSFPKLEKNKYLIKIDDNLSVPVISIDDLIAMKKKIGRPSDLSDIQALESLKKS